MTSKNLFFKLIWQDFKKRIWCPILIFIAYLLSMEAPLLNQFDMMKRYPTEFAYSMKHYIANDFFSPDVNMMNLFMTGIVAAVCAFSGYAYLHSKKQLDTYHSMPVKREVLFFSKYISGLIMFVVPFSLHILLCLVISLTNGAFSGHGMVNAIAFLVVQILCFLLIYSICIIAVCLTGNMIISILGGCVLVGYSTILSVIKDALCGTFFYTYMSSYSQPIWAFSPIGMLAKLIGKATEYREINTGFSYRCLVAYLLVIAIAIVIFTAFGAFLYKRRATEAAGKSIAFAITEPFIKSMVVLPFSVLAGFFIQSIVNYSSTGWLIFGIFFGYMVLALLMEIIFRLDIKCALYHWKQLIFNGVCLALLIIVFKFDVLGYNTYIPNEQEITGCAVSIDDLMDVYVEDYTEQYGYQYMTAEEYRFGHMNILDNPSALQLARKAAEEGIKYAAYDYYEGFEESPEYQAALYQEENYHSVAFKFVKNNGKEVYRRYWIDISDEETLGLLADVFNDSDYKLGAFPVFRDGWKKEYSGLECRSNDFYNDTIKLSMERQVKLLEVYQSDLLKLTLEDVMNTVPLGNMAFLSQGFFRNSYGGYEEGYKIYPQFTATIELLKEYGFDYTEKLTADRIEEVIVDRYCEEFWEDCSDDIYMEDNEIILKYTDEEKIKTILPNLINEDLMYGVASYFKPSYDSDNVSVCYKENGMTIGNSYLFWEGKTPSFIERDFEIKMEEMRSQTDMD